VIPFPGDWIGPREELIPIRAGEPADAEGPTEEPPGGDTFWTENSGEIHSVLLAPERPDREGRSPVRWTSRLRRALEQTRRAPAPTASSSSPSGSAKLAPNLPHRRRRSRGTTVGRPLSPCFRRTVVGTAVAIATIAGTGVLILTARPADPGRATGRTAAGAASSLSVSLAGTVQRSLDAFGRLHVQLPAHVAHTQSSRAPARKRRAPRTTRPHRVSSSLAGTPSSAVSVSHASAPPAITPSYTPTSAGQTQVPQTQSQQPAFGASGLLGPGSSPNG
jgi:hypothetical protein